MSRQRSLLTVLGLTVIIGLPLGLLKRIEIVDRYRCRCCREIKRVETQEVIVWRMSNKFGVRDDHWISCEDCFGHLKIKPDGTLVDIETGLTWMARVFPDETTYEEAARIAGRTKHAGYSDWRLPKKSELKGITCVFDQWPVVREGSDSETYVAIDNHGIDRLWTDSIRVEREKPLRVTQRDLESRDFNSVTMVLKMIPTWNGDYFSYNDVYSIGGNQIIEERSSPDLKRGLLLVRGPEDH